MRKISPETKALCEKTKALFATPEGRAGLLVALANAKRMSDKFKRDSRVDPETLRIPMDV
jgi:hypothetical protein